MVRNPVLDGPFDSAAVHALRVRIARLHHRRVVVDDLAVVGHQIRAVRTHDAEVLERIAVDDQQIADEPETDTAEPIGHADHLCAVRRGVLQHFERMEARLLVQLELA